jgi:hypothetical protein
MDGLYKQRLNTSSEALNYYIMKLAVNSPFGYKLKDCYLFGH